VDGKFKTQMFRESKHAAPGHAAKSEKDEVKMESVRCGYGGVTCKGNAYRTNGVGGLSWIMTQRRVAPCLKVSCADRSQPFCDMAAYS